MNLNQINQDHYHFWKGLTAIGPLGGSQMDLDSHGHGS
jgi:hypothetical protein